MLVMPETNCAFKALSIQTSWMPILISKFKADRDDDTLTITDSGVKKTREELTESSVGELHGFFLVLL
ncbi:hypothetical protein KC19_VG229800, partial [Ceratodon purpureus]